MLFAGNASTIGALLLGSASLTGSGTTAAQTLTAQNLSSAVTTANLDSQLQQEAFAQAILQSLQQLQTDSSPSANLTAVLVDVAFLAQSPNAVSEAFSQVRHCIWRS